MKKLIVGLFAALLTSTGLVALSGPTATAGHCPYTGCIPTDVSARAFSPKPGKVVVKYRVDTAGNATPRGQVRVVLDGKRNDVRRIKTAPYPKVSRAVFRHVPKGRYTVKVKFIPRPSSAWGHSGDTTSVRVR